MISKREENSNHQRVCKKSWRYRFTGGSDRYPDRSYPGAYRSSAGEPEGSSFQKRSSEMVGQRRGLLAYLKKVRSEGYRSDCKTWYQKIIRNKNGDGSSVPTLR